MKVYTSVCQQAYLRPELLKNKNALGVGVFGGHCDLDSLSLWFCSGWGMPKLWGGTKEKDRMLWASFRGEGGEAPWLWGQPATLY